MLFVNIYWGYSSPSCKALCINWDGGIAITIGSSMITLLYHVYKKEKGDTNTCTCPLDVLTGGEQEQKGVITTEKPSCLTKWSLAVLHSLPVCWSRVTSSTALRRMRILMTSDGEWVTSYLCCLTPYCCSALLCLQPNSMPGILGVEQHTVRTHHLTEKLYNINVHQICW